MNQLPDIFESFADARKDGFLAAKEFKDQGKVLIGTYCTYMPQELPLAMGAGVVSLCATSDETIVEAEKHLPRNLCPLIKSSYGFGLTDKCPYFYFSDLIVGESTCDGKKKMYEHMDAIRPTHVMMLPNSPEGEESLTLWKYEIHKLREKLEEKFDVSISDEDLKAAVRLRNRERSALKELYELQKHEPLAMSGLDLLKVLYGSTFKFDKEASIAEIKATADMLRERIEKGEFLEERPRILITGCPIGGVTEKVITAIEDNGGWVVYYENCMGAKAVDQNVDESMDDVELALAKKYIDIGCSCMTPNHSRTELLEQAIKDYKVDGVIDVTLQACHTYAVEAFTIKDFCQQQGVPYLNIETDYSTSDVAQLGTRAAAFIEML